MLNVKQGNIEYHFLSLSYDSTRDWTQVSRAIGEQFNHYANVLCFERIFKVDIISKFIVKIISCAFL